MKTKVIILFCILFNIWSCSHESNKSEKKIQNERSIVIDSLSRLNVDKYIGKNITDFLKDENFSSYRKIQIGESKLLVACSMVIFYNNGIYMELIPIKFKFMNPYNKNREWNIEDFKKERIGIIKIYKNEILIKTIR